MKSSNKFVMNTHVCNAFYFISVVSCLCEGPNLTFFEKWHETFKLISFQSELMNDDDHFEKNVYVSYWKPRTS